MKAQDTRALGASGLQVTTLTLGAAPLGNFYRRMNPAVARAIVDTAWDLGVRTFDTAPIYGFGLSEHRLGGASDGRPRSELIVSSKEGRRLRRSSDPGRDTGLWRDAARCLTYL